MNVLSAKLWFPDPEAPGVADAEGLVAIGGDLSVERLMLAYRSGIFPWSERPITWWSPDPRGILDLDAFHIPRSLRTVLRRRPFEVTWNRAFGEVMRGCAARAPGRRSTWISCGFLEAYAELHRRGHAHSVECWQNGSLVGGIYGVAIGGFFSGESMFHRVDNASKVALVTLIEGLRAGGCGLFDVQMVTPATAAMGAIEIPRKDYLQRLRGVLGQPRCVPACAAASGCEQLIGPEAGRN